MTSQHKMFKWLTLAILLVVFLGFALVSPSASAQEGTPPTWADGTPAPTSTETPAEIPVDETPLPTLMPTLIPESEESPMPFRVQGMDESAPLSTGWSLPLDISVTDFSSTQPAIAVDSNGGIHIVWSERENSGGGEIYYKYWNGVSWLAPINVSNSAAYESLNPQVTVDSSGRAHIVWEEQDDDYSFDVEIQYSQCSVGTCTSPVSLSGPPNWDCGRYYPNLQDWHSETPVIGIDQADRLMVVWRAFEPGEITQPYSTWLASGTPPSKPSGCARMVGSSTGSHRVMGGAPGEFALAFEAGNSWVYYSKYAGGRWDFFSYLGNGGFPDLFWQSTGQAHITWCGSDNQIRYRNSATSITEVIPGTICNGYAPVAVDADGYPRVFWGQSGQVYESKRLPEGWSEGVNISQSTVGAASPDVAVDGNGYLHLVWYDARDGNYEIYYATTAPGRCVTDTFEPDNLYSTGSTILIGEEQRHSLCPQNDEDWANFRVSTTRSVNGNLLAETFDLEPDSINPNGNTQLTVFDESTTNQIGTNQDRGFGPFPGSTDIIKSSRVVWHPAIGGLFNIKVFPEKQINEQKGSGYSLRLINPLTPVDPVDQRSWVPTKVNVPFVTRSGNAIYFTQFFTYEQAELDALNAVPATLAWEFRRPEVNPKTGVEIDGSNVDYGDYWQNVNGVCVGEYWTNLPSHTDKFVEESNSIGCQPLYPDNPLAPNNEEFELYVDDPTQLIADKAYYITIKFYIHQGYLNSEYQFYVSKAEYCQLWNERDFICNLGLEQVVKHTANLIEGYLQPTP